MGIIFECDGCQKTASAKATESGEVLAQTDGASEKQTKTPYFVHAAKHVPLLGTTLTRVQGSRATKKGEQKMITGETTTPNYIDASTLCAFTRCPARFYFSRILGLHSREESTIAVDFGTCIHLALPLCYSESTLPLAFEAFENAWKAFSHGESDPKRNTPRAIQMLTNFYNCRKGSRCPYEIVSFSKVVPPNCTLVSENEIPFLIDIGGPLPLAGRIDLAVRWKADGKTYPCDYKTASEVSARYFENFWNAPQTLSYMVAIAHLTGTIPPGMIIEAIRVSPKNDEVSMFPVHVWPHLLERFISWANETAESILKCCEKKEFLQNPVGCSPYASFGSPGFTCAYKALCDAPDWTAISPCYEKRDPYHPFEIGA